MVLTILAAATLGLLGFFGLFRGVRRGLIAVAGTLLGAVLVDLWQDRWSAWLPTQVESPSWPTFLLTAAIFVLVALLVGYGGSLLLPRRDPKAKPPGLFDRLLGGLVGALNGALIVSYLLRYAGEIWADGAASDLIAASLAASLLDAWLPWFMLAMVAATAVFVLLRGLLRLMRALNPPPAPLPPIGAGQKGQPAQGAPTVVLGGAQAAKAAPKPLSEADRRLLEKINQVQGDK